jgi:hypothetical protein
MVKRLLQAMLGLLLAAPTVALAANPASAEDIGFYKIQAMHSGKCVTPWGNTTDGSPVIQISCDQGASSFWHFLRYGWVDGMPVYEIQSAWEPGTCLDLTANNVDNGTFVQLWTCNGGPQQKWVQRYFGKWNGRDIYQLHPYSATNKCLDVRDLSQFDFAPLQVWDCA